MRLILWLRRTPWSAAGALVGDPRGPGGPPYRAG